MASKVFFGGIPTDVDVNKLKSAYPTRKLLIGDIFLYSEIEKLLGLNRRDYRFRTVTSRWRKLVELESNKIIGADPDREAFWVLSESDKIELMRSKMRSSVRFSRRAYIISARTDRKLLTSDDVSALDHLTFKAAQVLAIGQLKTGVALPAM